MATKESRSVKKTQAAKPKPQSNTKTRINKNGKKKPSEQTALIVVGIGSSAGGLEALTLLLQHIPVNTQMSFVIAQHLDPKRSSMMVQLLSRHTQLEILEVISGVKLQAKKIYITPPNQLVRYKDDKLFLETAGNVIGPKPSVDIFFTSLAEGKAEKAVGIILSGTGSDGAHGIRAIKTAGGITMVQEESTAKFDGMPHAANLTGQVDFVLSPEEIGEELNNLSKFPRIVERVKQKKDEKFDFHTVMSLLLNRTGCDFAEYKESTISRRIERRMTVNRIEVFKDYVAFLQHSHREVELLYKDILISVTSFFRDREVWQALKTIVDQIIKHKKPGDSIRIWVPGCATGEEAYSLCILFIEGLGERLANLKLQIYGTDLDKEAIDYARRAIYPEATVVDVDGDYLEKYFTKIDNKYQVNSFIRERVIFARHNLIADPPFLHLDLVTCRNLLIYFKNSLQAKVFPIFHYALNPSGYLMLGKHEAVGDFFYMFYPIEKTHKIYQRRNSTVTSQLQIGHKVTRTLSKEVVPRASVNEHTIEDLVKETIVQKYDPPAVVIDTDMAIKYIRGDVSEFLTLKAGKLNLNILSLVIEPLRVELRVLLHKAFKEEQEVKQNGLVFNEKNNNEVVNLSVCPITQELEGHEKTYLIIFEKGVGELVQKVVTGDNGDDPRITVLESELNSARERVQTIVEELETANEELQSMNEELQSSNEELQSSNEELETSNEELQATNEELITVNEEFQVKSAELAITNTDLENILNSIESPMIVVDSELKIKRFTSSAKQIFNMESDSIGQVLTTIGCNISLPELRKDVISVINKGKIIEKRVGDDRFEYWMNIYPYFSEHNKIVGAVLTLMDKTELIKANNTLHLLGSRLKKMFEFNPGGIAITDTNSRIIDANSAFVEFLGIKGDVKNCLVINIEDLSFTEAEKRLIVEVLQGDLNYFQFEKQIQRKKDDLWLNITISGIDGDMGKPMNGLIVIQDITKLKTPPTKKKQAVAI